MVVNLSEQYSLLSDWIGEIRDVEIQEIACGFAATSNASAK